MATLSECSDGRAVTGAEPENDFPNVVEVNAVVIVAVVKSSDVWDGSADVIE